MDDDALLADPGLEAPATEEPADDGAAPEPELDADGNPVPQEPEPVEIDLGGKKYRIHPDLRDGVMQHADYTLKTMALAEQRRAFAAQQQAATVEQGDYLRAKATEVAIDEALKAGINGIAYDKIDWQAWHAGNPQAAQAAQMRYQQLKDAKANAGTALKEADDKRTQASQRDLAERARATEEFARTSIKGWTPALNKQVMDFATGELKLPAQAIIQNLSPELYRTLHLARIGHTVEQKAKAAKTPANGQQQKPQEPTQAARGRGAPGAGPNDKESIDAWMKKREAQVRRRG